MKKEEWRVIPGYDGLYMVSNFGRVKSMNYKCTGKERILNPLPNRGYLSVVLYKNGKGKQYKVHRLVAMAFIPNPDNLPCVNHKDEDKTNNRVENLEWCNHSYNNNYGNHGQRIAEKNKNGKRSIPIEQYSLDWVKIAEYPSAREAARQNDYDFSGIGKDCKGDLKTYKNCYWRYKEPQAS